MAIMNDEDTHDIQVINVIIDEFIQDISTSHNSTNTHSRYLPHATNEETSRLQGTVLPRQVDQDGIVAETMRGYLVILFCLFED